MKTVGSVAAGAGAGAVAGVQAVHGLSKDLSKDLSVEQGKALLELSGEAVAERLDSLERRFDELEHHQKNLIRVGAIAFTVSTGIDVLTIL